MSQGSDILTYKFNNEIRPRRDRAVPLLNVAVPLLNVAVPLLNVAVPLMNVVAATGDNRQLSAIAVSYC